MYYFKNGTVVNNSGVSLRKKGSVLTVKNTSLDPAIVLLPKVYKREDSGYNFNFFGKIVSGNATKPPILKVISLKRETQFEVPFNSTKFVAEIPVSKFMLALYICGNTEVEITDTRFEAGHSTDETVKNNFKGNVLVLSPGYPSEQNRYMCGFVHTRVKEYVKLGWNVDVCEIGLTPDVAFTEFEGVKVVRTNFAFLREILWQRKYDRILIHFFNENFANVLDKMYLEDTKLYFYLHGAETLYRDWAKITSSYFAPPVKITTDLEDLFKRKDDVIRRYNEKPNVTWFFVTPWTQKRSEELLGIKYKNAKVLPCLIDTDTFVYRDHDPELRKKIFVLRKFENPFTYSLDICVRIVQELSRRPFFNDLEFDFYGDGSLFDIFKAPLEKFENVHFHRGFLNHKEISEVHRTHGIALFPSRYDSQAVSSCEAASSGCAVVSTINPGVEQEIYPKYNTLCNQENYKEYADVIERLYYNSDEFKAIGKGMAEDIRAIYGYDNTIQKELDIFREDEAKPVISSRTFEPLAENPVLTVIIPAYNVEKYLKHTVWTLVDHRNAHKLEILIVNDGSKDRTREISLELEKMTATAKGSIVRLIDKENGGHGSVLNKGVEIARGKYLKVIDGDDTVDSEEFARLIDILENSESDVVLNDYVIDISAENKRDPHREYEFMIPGVEYHYDDLCYDGSGFREWGPLLSTANCKVEMLRRRPFKITEKILYDDQEWNAHVIANSDTIVYHPMDLYLYLIGREGQSASKTVLHRRYPFHRIMVLNLISIYETVDCLTPEKKSFLENKMITTLIKFHYQLVTTDLQSKKAFLEFDRELKKHPRFYNHPAIICNKIKLHRLTGGCLMFIHKYEHQIRKLLGRA